MLPSITVRRVMWRVLEMSHFVQHEANAKIIAVLERLRFVELHIARLDVD